MKKKFVQLAIIFCLLFGLFTTIVKANPFIDVINTTKTMSFYDEEQSFPSEIPICKGQCTGNIGIQTTDCFKWFPEEGLLDPSSSITQACPQTNTDYRLVITNNEGNVVQELSYTIIVSTPGVTISPTDPIICNGSPTRLEALIWESPFDYNFNWSTNETTQFIEVEEPGTFSVTVTHILTGCQDISSVVVQGNQLNANIEASSIEICEGLPVELEAIVDLPNGIYTYDWSNGGHSNPITVTESGAYVVTVTSHDTGCEVIANIELIPIEFEVNIIPKVPIVCPNGEVTLKTELNSYISYHWNTGETINQITVNNTGEYIVTVTNAIGCQATTMVEVKDATNPDVLFAFFQSKGFFAKDIEILGPAFTGSGVGDKKLPATLCDATDPCSVDDGCVQDDASLAIRINGTDISTLKAFVSENLSYFKNTFDYDHLKAYITKNNDICSCSDYLEKVEDYFNSGELAHWIHLWESNSLLSDKLFILTNVPSSDGHIPGSLGGRTEFLQSGQQIIEEDNGSGNLGSEGAQAIFALMDHSLDNHLSITPFINNGTGSSAPVCESFIVENAIGLSPADIPVQLSAQTFLRFGAPPGWHGSFPDGAMSGFTINEQQGQFYYNGRSNKGGNIFEGYLSMSIRGDFNTINPYVSLPFVAPPRITLGLQAGTGAFVAQQRDYKCSLPTPGTGYGNIVQTLNYNCLGDVIQSSDPYNIDLPPATTVNFTSSQHYKLCEWYGGTFIKIENENEISSYYITEDLNNPGQYIIYAWNCVLGLWQPYSPTDPSLTDQLILEHILCLFDGGDCCTTGEAINTPKCFELTAEQVGEFSFTGSTGNYGNVVDHIGINDEELTEIQTAIQDGMAWWGLNMNIILSGDYQPGGDVPVNPFGSAAFEFMNYDMSTTDFLMWTHYRNNGTANFCIKFGENYFDNAGDADKVKQVVVNAIGKGRFVTVATHTDNPVVDPDFPPAGNASDDPAYFGVRPGYEDKITFYNVIKEVAGVSLDVMENAEINSRIWEKNGDCLFDTPGGLIGAGNALIEENPVAGMIQGVSFVTSFVESEETRHAIFYAIKHPAKVVAGIAQKKYEIYSGQQGAEPMHYEAGSDGVGIILALLSGKQIINALSAIAKEAAEKLKKQLDKAPESFNNNFYKEFENVSDQVQQEYLEFFGEIGIDHYAKLTQNPKLFRVWEKYRSELDMKPIYQKFPEDSPQFYEKFFDVFLIGDDVLPKTKTFLDDIRNNDALVDIFKGEPKAIDAWDVLNEANRPNLRKSTDTDLLSNLGDLINDNDFPHPNGSVWEKPQFVNTFKKHGELGFGSHDRSFTDEEGVANMTIGNSTLKAHELTDALKLARDEHKPRVGDVVKKICCGTELEYIGAEWTLRYSKNKWIDILSFELFDNSNGANRIIDVIISFVNSTKRVELKSWLVFHPDYNFIGQFRADLLQEPDIVNIKWVFDKKGTFGLGGLNYLKNSVRQSINANNTLLDHPVIFEKFEMFSGVDFGNDINQLLNYLNNNDTWFNQIFSVE